MKRHLLTFCLCFFGGFSASACGYFLLGDSYRIAILNPFVIGDEYAPFFYGGYTIKPKFWKTGKRGRDRQTNVEAWAQELGGGVTGEDVMQILYETNLQDWLKAQKGIIPSTFKKNPAWAIIKKQPDLLEYILYAKGYEKAGQDINKWWDEKKPKPKSSRYEGNFKARAKAGYQKAVQGSFLKDRYAYQLLLLAFYENDQQALGQYYTKHFEKRKGPLAVWARFHYASKWRDPGEPNDYTGLENGQEKKPRYTVEMANAFRYAPEKAIPAFNRSGDHIYRLDPRKYLKATTSNTEKSNLYALAAVKEKGHALGYLKKAYALDPSNHLVELILVREISKLEDWLMTYELTYSWPSTSSKKGQWHSRSLALRETNYRKDRAYLKSIRVFLATYKHTDKNLLKLLRAQTALLDEDFDGALRYSDNMDLADASIQVQVKILRYMAIVQSLKTNQVEKGNYIARTLPELEAMLGKQYQLKGALSLMASIDYAEKKDTVTAYFLHVRSRPMTTASITFRGRSNYDYIDYLDRPISREVIDRIIELLEDPKKGNKLQQELSTKKINANTIRDVAGMQALRRNDLKTALEYFSGLPKNWQNKKYLQQSPLGDGMTSHLPFISKAQVVRELIVLEEMSSNGGEEGAMACLNLAIAWYNMSDYGTSWMMLRYGKSAYDAPILQPWPFGRSIPHNQLDFDVVMKASRAKDYLDCVEATTKAPELLAQVSFIRAKFDVHHRQALAEKNHHLSSKKLDSTFQAQYIEAFSPFAQQYCQTDYFELLLNQCSAMRVLE